MVGFVHHDQDEESNPPPKAKNPVDSTWCDKFDFLDQFVPELDDLSLPGNSFLLDFDSIQDWIEEMQDPVEMPEPNHGGDVLVEGGPTVEDACFLKTERLGGVNEELVPFDDSGECLRKEGQGLESLTVEAGGDGEKLLSLNSVVEEGLGKVSLVDEVEFDDVEHSIRKGNAVVSGVLEGDNDKSSDCESGSKSCSAASSSSSSSSDEEEEDDDDDDAVDEGEKKGVIKEGECEVKEDLEEDDDDVVDEGEKKGVIKEGVSEVNEDLEEGEIMETDADKMVCWSNEGDEEDDSKDSFSKGGASGEIFMDDDDDEDVVLGPIMSKNELKVLPPVPPVDVTLQPSHQMLPVGVVNSILGAQVIVEGGEKHNPLSEGSILWITERRSPLGRVDEIFGPVKNPYYIVRYNSESEVPEGLHEGILVSFVPEFVDHVLNNKNLYQKGYDASGNNDEEVDEAEFSDDEKEAEYRRMLKLSKRGNNADTKPGGYKKSNSSFKRNDQRSNNSMQTNDLPPVQANNVQNQQFEAPIRPPTDHNIQPSSSRFGSSYTARPSVIPGFPQQGQPPRFIPNGVQPNGMPFQMQNQQFANGFQMPWIQQHQNLQPHPMMNARPPFQQGFNPAGPAPNNIIPSNTGLGPSFSPSPAGSMVPNALNQVPLSMALQAQLAQLSMLSGMLLAGQGGPPPSLPPQNAELGPPQFNQGAASSQHGGSRPFQHRGGRSRGGGGGRRGGRRPFQSR